MSSFHLDQIAINVLENVENYGVLMVGRVLGGISTALLFCAFESWMVSEHFKRGRNKPTTHRHQICIFVDGVAAGFDQRSLSKTFATASEINGILAVVAGLVAQVAADTMGEIGPFHLAVAVTGVAFVFVYQWPENYGSNHKHESPNESSPPRSQQPADKNDAKGSRLMSCALGFAYSLFDGTMYIFGKLLAIDSAIIDVV